MTLFGMPWEGRMCGSCKSRSCAGRNFVPATNDDLLIQSRAGDRKMLSRLLEEAGPLVRRKLGSIAPKPHSVLTMNDVKRGKGRERA